MRQAVFTVCLLAMSGIECGSAEAQLQPATLTYHSSARSRSAPDSPVPPAVHDLGHPATASELPAPPGLPDLPQHFESPAIVPNLATAADRMADEWHCHPAGSWFRFTIDDLQAAAADEWLTADGGCGESTFNSCGEPACLHSDTFSECGESVSLACHPPTISFAAGSIFLKREDPSGTVLMSNGLGTQRLRAGDFNCNLAAGVDFQLTHHTLIDGADLEVRYFEVGDWKDQVARNLTGGPIRLNLATPLSLTGSRSVRSLYSSQLQNLEINFVRAVGRSASGLQMTTGFRYLNLNERLSSILSGGGANDFLQSRTSNHLYGFQIGLAAPVVATRNSLIESYARFGIFGAETNARTTVGALGGGSLAMTGRGDNTAIMGEWGVRAEVSLTDRTRLYGGYQMLLLDGVALASKQIPLSQPGLSNIDVANSSVFFHGASFGLEFRY